MNQKRLGRPSLTQDGRKLSGGAFAAQHHAEGPGLAPPPPALPAIPAHRAFSPISDVFEGSESNWSQFYSYKPSAETARRMRLIFDLPPGNAAGFKIEEFESSSGDGWASDTHDHTVEVRYKGQTLLVLDGENPMERLRQRIAHSHRDVVAEAEILLNGPDHERWVKLHSDRFGNPFTQIAKLVEVREDAIVTRNMGGERIGWPLTGDDGFLLGFSREEALKDRPNLAFTEEEVGKAAGSLMMHELHSHWLERNHRPVTVTFTDYSMAEPELVTADARNLTITELTTHLGAGFLTLPKDFVLDYCKTMDHPPTHSELEAAAKDISAKIKSYEKDLERLHRRTREAPYRPTTDTKEIRRLLDLAWANYT